MGVNRRKTDEQRADRQHIRKHNARSKNSVQTIGLAAFVTSS